MGRPTKAIIDLDNLAANIRAISAFAPESELMPIIKANAYGHGAKQVAARLFAEGIRRVGVATPGEAFELLDSGIAGTILVLGIVDTATVSELIARRLEFLINEIPQMYEIDRIAARLGLRAQVHIKVDTGMGRIGITETEHEAFFKAFAEMKNIDVVGIMSHLADADDLESGYPERQIKMFHTFSTTFIKHFGPVLWYHIQNSSGIFRFWDKRLNLARPGLSIYGYNPVRTLGDIKLMPVLSLVSRIGYIKNISTPSSISYGRTYEAKPGEIIATVPIGYADGIPRALSNRARFLVNGVLVPLVGRVTMDMIMVDVTRAHAAVGDRIVLIGSDGAGTVTAYDWADIAGTIPYEILCNISLRVSREYREGKS